MAFEDLKKKIDKLNYYSDFRYHVWQYARIKHSNHYNDRKIVIYFENNDSYLSPKKYLKLFEIHEHRFGSMNSLSKYMGYQHKDIYELCIDHTMKKRSERAPITNKYWLQER